MNNLFRNLICYIYWVALRLNGFDNKLDVEDRFILWKAEAFLNFILCGIYLPIFFLINRSLLNFSKMEVIGYFLPIALLIAIILNRIIRFNFDQSNKNFMKLLPNQKLKYDVLAGCFVFTVVIWFAVITSIIKS